MLFDASIRDNIRLGLPNATQDEIEEAAKQANAHDFIVSFPDGYDTLVGIGGTQVSGGEKQRISIGKCNANTKQTTAVCTSLTVRFLSPGSSGPYW